MMPIEIVKAVKAMFPEIGESDAIPSLQGELFDAQLLEEGVKAYYPSGACEIAWSEFQETVDIMTQGPREAGFYVSFIKGLPAYVVYGAQLSCSVHRKIAPLLSILIWAQICRYESGFVILNN
ncbi:MAG: hypothetical protein ABRQ26_10805 [Syntrophomonadaceae bacterium]